MKFSIKTNATTANMGPGFDALGASLSLNNEFKITTSDNFEYEGWNEKFANENNLFIQSYKKTCKFLKINDKIKVKFIQNIPFCRGLGSSASLIIGGIKAAAYIYEKKYNKKMSKEEMLKIAVEIEGHPDNVAPCLYGGMCISYNDKKHNILKVKKVKISKKIFPTIFIPNYEVSTEKARNILPKSFSLKDVVNNQARLALLIKSLEDGNLDDLKYFIKDIIHIPYRKKLIKNYEKIENICMENGASAFTISGSGSSMIALTGNKNFSKKISKKLPKNIMCMDLNFT